MHVDGPCPALCPGSPAVAPVLSWLQPPASAPTRLCLSTPGWRVPRWAWLQGGACWQWPLVMAGVQRSSDTSISSHKTTSSGL